MKIGVMGAGAVGCFYGGMLARAGHEVVLIGRPAHVEAIKRDGLDMEMQTFRERVRVAASTEPAALAGADVVLCCVKSGDSAQAAAEMAPYLGANTTLFSLQNGVDNAERLSAALGREVVPAVVYVATEMAGPGHLRHHGRGELVIAPAPGSEAFKTICDAAGVPVSISDNVAGALWSKLVVNCAYNGLSAITQLPYGRIVQGENVWPMLRDIVDECTAVAEAAGIRLLGDPWQNTEAIARTMATQVSSTAHDLARGRRTEIDYINGHVVARGAALGVPTPVNRAIHAIVRLMEGR
jgi:2-dehydropantoate 2-reductase